MLQKEVVLLLQTIEDHCKLHQKDYLICESFFLSIIAFKILAKMAKTQFFKGNIFNKKSSYNFNLMGNFVNLILKIILIIEKFCIIHYGFKDIAINVVFSTFGGNNYNMALL